MTQPKTVYPSSPKELPKTLGHDLYGLDFDPANDAYVNVPDDASLRLDHHTIVVFCEPDIPAGGDGNNHFFIAKGTGGEKNYILAFDDSGHLWYGFHDTTGTWHDITSSKDSWEAEYFCFVGSFDGSELQLRYNKETVAPVSVSATPVTTTVDLNLGKEPTTTINYLDGTEALVLLYNRALSEAEKDRCFEEYHNPPRTGLVGWWKLDEGKGTSIKDYSGEGNDGTASNTTWKDVAKWELRAEAGL